MSQPPFHLAFPVRDLAEADAFYHGLIGCKHGRRSDHWIDYDFFGHQLVAHLAPEECAAPKTNDVDGDKVPVRHFGVVMAPADWRALAEKFQAAKLDFVIEPDVRLNGEVGEQGTMFIADPSGNMLEFKYFEDMSQLFAS